MQGQGGRAHQQPRPRQDRRRHPCRRRRAREAGQSVGAPWRGRLRSASRLVAGAGYPIRRPHRTYGTASTIKQLRRARGAFHAKFPKAHTVAIGDLSAKDGGKISDHRSHQSGRDVDVGLVFKRKPAGYPASFVDGDAENLDLAATWGLLKAFVRTADEARGVSNVFLDFEVQGLLYTWAKKKGVDAAYLRRIFQYPHGRGAAVGLVRHEPGHADHLHVRFKCAPEDKSCD
ncbi:MAG: penicillin-insensitive murein endopeptidase [Kofleriaceae bacterium]